MTTALRRCVRPRLLSSTNRKQLAWLLAPQGHAQKFTTCAMLSKGTELACIWLSSPVSRLHTSLPAVMLAPGWGTDTPAAHNDLPSSPRQGPFPLAHLRAWFRAGDLPEAMPVVHIGSLGLKVRLDELCARPLPARPVASGVAAAAPANPASGDCTANGVHVHAARAGGQKQQPAHDVQRTGTSRASVLASSRQEAVANGDASGSARVPADMNPAMHVGAADVANATSLPSLPEAAQKVNNGLQQPQHSMPIGIAAPEGVGLQHPQTDIVPGKTTVDTEPGEPQAAPPRSVSTEEAPGDASRGSPQLPADAVPAAPGAAASQPQQPADPPPEAGAAALSAAAASRPQLRSVERMAVGKTKYSVTVRAKVACRLFADARGEVNMLSQLFPNNCK